MHGAAFAVAILAAASPIAAGFPEPGEVEIVKTRTFDVGGLDVQAELGRLFVPENRRKPDSGTIELAFGRLRSPAASPAPPVVYLAGGPGGSATQMADDAEARASWRPLLELCDLILLDQRGTGRSRPKLTWVPPDTVPTDLFLSEASALLRITDVSRRAAAHFREQGVDLAGYTTVESADDIDDLRKALGLEKISLLGFSYGTHLGLAAIRRHGEHLADVILIGTEGPDETFKLPSNADTQLRKLALLAARDPSVGPFVPDLVALLERVLARLDREPMVVSVTDGNGRRVKVPVGRFGLQMILRFDLGDGSDVGVFPKLLYSIDQGDPSVLQWFVQKRFGTLGPVNAMGMVMDGASGAPPGRWERIHAEARPCLLGNAMNFPYPEINEVWGTPDLGDEFRSPIVTDVRTLFVSGTLDWNTPPYQAERVRFGFTNAAHIIVEGAGHEQILPQPEIQRAIVEFLRGGDVGSTRVLLPPLRFLPVVGFDPQVTHPSAGLAHHLSAVAREQGFVAAIAEYNRVRPGLPGGTEAEINAFGYDLLGRGSVQDAIVIFQMNADDYPDSFNTWDSLAEAYKEAGDRQKAIELYEKSLRLNPKNANATRMLEELRAP